MSGETFSPRGRAPHRRSDLSGEPPGPGRPLPEKPRRLPHLFSRHVLDQPPPRARLVRHRTFLRPHRASTHRLARKIGRPPPVPEGPAAHFTPSAAIHRVVHSPTPAKTRLDQPQRRDDPHHPPRSSPALQKKNSPRPSLGGGGSPASSVVVEMGLEQGKRQRAGANGPFVRSSLRCATGRVIVRGARVSTGL